MPQRIKVLFVGAFPPSSSRVFGGNISDCRELLRSHFGRELDLLLIDSTQETVPPPPLFRRAALAARRAVRFARTLHSGQPAVTIIFSASGFSFLEKSLMALYARAFGVPTLMSIRSGHFIDLCRRSRLFRAAARLLVKGPRYLVCQGEAWRTFLVSTLRVPPDRCPIIENWVATAELLSLGRSRPPLAPPEARLLFVGWLERFKGLYELLESIRRLDAAHPTLPFALDIAGEGSESNAVRTWVAANALEHRIRILGWVEGARKLDAYRRATIFVLPSYTEGLPNAMIEAMAAGLAPVVTPVGSIPDVITSGNNGVLVAPRSADSLTNALSALLTDPDKTNALALAAFATAQSRFGTEEAAARWLTLIAKASSRTG